MGAADPSSAIDMPTKRMKMLATNHCNNHRMNAASVLFRSLMIGVWKME